MAALSRAIPVGEIACGSKAGRVCDNAVPCELILIRESKGYSVIEAIAIHVGSDKE